MGDISTVIAVGIANTPNSRDASPQSLAQRIDLGTQHFHTELSRQIGPLRRTIVRDERAAHLRAVVGEIDLELVELQPDRRIVHNGSILNTGDVKDGLVIDCHIVGLEHLSPIRVVLIQDGDLLCGVGSVGVNSDILVQGRVQFSDSSVCFGNIS